MSGETKILVIDDEPSVCKSCVRLLAHDGLEADMASTARDAVHKLKTQHYDLVLLDLRIPGAGGLTLLPFLRDEYPATQVIVITGYPSIENAKESILLGAFDFLCKPVDPEKLRTVVTRALASKPWMLQKR